MATTLIRKGETLVYSTRWFDDEVAQRGQEADHTDGPAERGAPGSPKIAVQIVIREQNDERLAALSQRPTLFGFLKHQVRSHAGASL